MNNLLNTEKALKHWFKNKVTVTTATVVGFLIMGTVSFGAESKIIIKENEIRNETVSGKDISINGNNTTGKFGKIDINKEAIVNGVVADSNEAFNIVNNGEIIVESTGIGVRGATGINVGETKNFKIENYKLIQATTFDGSSYGIFINNKDTELETSSIENSGDIITEVKNGGSAVPIYINAKVKKDNSLTINNTGNLVAKRTKNSEGRGALAAVFINSIGEGTVSFTNDGSIEADQAIAVEVTGKNSTFKNIGHIKLSNGSIAVKNNNGNVEIRGIVEVTDKNGNEIDREQLFVGVEETNIKGMVKGKDGKAIENSNSVYLSGNLTTDEINKAGLKSKSVTLGTKDTTVSGENYDSIKLDSLNIIGDVNIKNVQIENTVINLDKFGIIKIGSIGEGWNSSINKPQFTKEGSKLEITNGTINKDVNEIAVELKGDSKLQLNNVRFNGGIVNGEVNKADTNKYENIVGVLGDTYINGKIGVDKITIGDEKNSKNSLTLSTKSKFIENTLLKNELNGITVFEIDKDGNNALSNSIKAITVKGNIDFDTTNLTSNIKVELNNEDENVTHDLSGATYTNKTTGVYTTKLDRTDNKNTLEFTYNRNLFEDARLNTTNNEAQIVNSKFSQVVSEREVQMDKLYSGAIYSETVRASYDNLKLNERTILSLNNDVKAGDFRAEGKAIYGKDEYKREGVVGRYDVENETSGLLASLEYGLTDTTKTGLVFAGSKQDLDAAFGNADGDLFYLGLYGVKSVGNYDFTAGLGYQLGKYEANNTAANVLGTDKYDTEAISGYVQAKYLGDLGRGLSIQPKVKLGYTYLKQDDVKDSYFGLTDAEVKTFDTELGADLVKTVKFEKSTLDIKLGTAFVKTFGDTDKAFKGQFFGTNATSNQFDVLGARLSENVLKFNLGVEVENENGFFYNGGFTYEFGSENMESCGANIGIGYRF